ncbi:MAG: SAM-dependent methyltransferase [Phenylobacterium sp. RIFCSPHIGHO2_01_FULL_70_10]|nr:MAG: SAM-dependent methyltransferase [Phenylobacterium sp. RIFCSPHIGHO2_01_FULL_70_10]
MAADPAPPTPNADQAALWNGPAGHAWVQAQALMDDILAPMARPLAEGAAGAQAVLDVGCGAGSVSRAIARRLGPAARVTGLDISEPLIAHARRLAAAEGSAAQFVCADAQTYGFETGVFDRVVSRFGVMFFDDPAAAFATLRRACRAGARLHLIAWRSAAENPFMTTAERAAAPLLPQMPPRPAGGPGQFAFAEAARVRAILDAAGWSEPALHPFDADCALPKAELMPYLTRFGPLGLVLPQLEPEMRERVTEAVGRAFQPFVEGDQVRFRAACWEISAVA